VGGFDDTGVFAYLAARNLAQGWELWRDGRVGGPWWGGLYQQPARVWAAVF